MVIVVVIIVIDVVVKKSKCMYDKLLLLHYFTVKMSVSDSQ